MILWPGEAERGVARLGLFRLGKVRRVVARRGRAWPGEARQGMGSYAPYCIARNLCASAGMVDREPKTRQFLAVPLRLQRGL